MTNMGKPSSENKKRIAIVQEYLPHYRAPFFEKLNNLSKYQWELMCGPHLGEGFSGLAIDTEAPLPIKPIRHFTLGKFSWRRGVSCWLRECKYDAVVFGLGWPILSNVLLPMVARQQGTAVIAWSKGISESGKNRSALFNAYQKLYLQQCDAMLVYGHVSKKYFTDIGVPAGKIFIAQNTIDTLKIARDLPFSRQQALLYRNELELTDKIVVGYLGRLSKEKKIDNIIQAFSIISKANPDIHLLIAGDGPEREKLEVSCADLDYRSRIHFLGKIPIEQQDACLESFDIYVSAYAGGLGILEAMAHQKKIVITPESRPETELIQDGLTGYITRGFSVENLADSIMDAVQNQNEDMAKRAQSKVLECATLEKMVRSFDDAVDYAFLRR